LKSSSATDKNKLTRKWVIKSTDDRLRCMYMYILSPLWNLGPFLRDTSVRVRLKLKFYSDISYTCIRLIFNTILIEITLNRRQKLRNIKATLYTFKVGKYSVVLLFLFHLITSQVNRLYIRRALSCSVLNDLYNSPLY
jgi:cell division inhibitor SulA